MKVLKRLYFLAILSIICLSLVKSEQQKTMEDYLEIEREFGTQTFDFKNSHLNFLADTGSEVIPDGSGSGIVPAALSSFDKLIDGLFKSTNVYLKMVEAFKTKRTSEIKEFIGGKGFEHFAATGQIKITKGLKEEYLDRYVSNLAKLVKIPDDHKQAVDILLSEIGWNDANQWNNFKFAFTIGIDSEAKFASVYTYRNPEKNNYDIVYLDFQGTFKLAPDTIVIKKTFMLLGGIWGEDKEVYEKKDRALTEEGIDAVMNFVSILAFKGLGDQFGIKFELPKFN